MHTDPPAPLTLLLQTAARWVEQGTLDHLHAAGHTGLTAAHLTLLGNLDCGTTHAAAVAQRMGVSRQAIYRTVHELQALGLLRLADDPQRGNQKLVVMTEAGIALVTDARAALAQVEAVLADRIGSTQAAALRAALEAGWGPVPGA